MSDAMEGKSPRADIKLMLGATGVVFGDIGTSPLYAFRESFIGHHRLPMDQFHAIAVVLVIVFTTWRRGRQLLEARLASATMPVDLFLKSTAKVTRVPSTAVYLTSSAEGVPPALLHNLKCNLVRHERILLVTVETALTPRVAADARLTQHELGEGVSRVLIRYGFAEHPDIPVALAALSDPLPPASTYFLSRQTLIATNRPGMIRWREKLFAAMVRNAESPMSFFKLPVNRVVELGSQVEI